VRRSPAAASPGNRPWRAPRSSSSSELERLRTTFQWKADDLDAAGLQTRIGASSLTLGGLLEHLAFVEDCIFTVERSRARLEAALAEGGLDQLGHVSDGEGRHASLRRLVCDLIEEYGRHTGHAETCCGKRWTAWWGRTRPQAGDRRPARWPDRIPSRTYRPQNRSTGRFCRWPGARLPA
jgi:hypothetical protein